MSTQPRNGADAVIDCLVAEGVTEIFGLPGTTIMDIIDATARRSDLRYISVRHEQVAGFMADGYSRASGRLGVALVSRGPGAANLAIAVQNANDESIPMLVLVGQVPEAIVERRAFEEMDVVATFRPISKWAVEVNSTDRIPELLQRAVRTAVTGRPGPVVVSLPLNVIQDETTAVPGKSFRAEPPSPSCNAVGRAARLLAGAERPVLILGGGAGRVPHAELVELASRAGSPVVTTWLRKNLYPNDDPRFAGTLGYGSHAETDELVAAADLVVAIGCRFSEFTTKSWTLLRPTTSLVHVDIDPAEIGRIYAPELGVVSDSRAFVSALSAALPEGAGEARRDYLAAARRGYLDAATLAVPASQEPGLVGSAGLVVALRQLVSRGDVVLVQDVHTFGPWLARYLEVSEQDTYYGAAGGAMAWGFPAAMGAARARPDRHVVAVSGDGSFWMVAQDLETCVREDIPVVNVVVNNFAYGNTRDRQASTFGGRYHGVFLGNPDFAAFARNVGAHGERVTDSAELLPAMERAIASGLPAVVDIIQDRMEGLPDGLKPLKPR